MTATRFIFVALAITLAAIPTIARAQEASDPQPEAAVQAPAAALAEPEPKKANPFAFADFTWLSGNPRTKESPLDSKVFTGEFRADTNFTYRFNKPADDTIGGSREIFRSGEFQVTQLGIGGDFHYDTVQGRLMTQLGMYSQTTPRNDASPARESQGPVAPQAVHWDYGGFVDVGYLRDFNDPSNHLFRSRGTTFHVNEWDLNMAGAYVKKKGSEQSRWGTELLVQGGRDEEVFGFSATAPNLDGADVLGHLGLANVSYLAPVGTGLSLQSGIFASFIGYDSLYAKDNTNYTRPWGADFTPYLMTGVNASYEVSDRATVTGFVVNGYWHLAHANSVPSLGGQVAYKTTARVTVKETLLVGPHQANTAVNLWRVLSDTIVERRGDRVTAAFEAQLSTETVDAAGNPRASWISLQAPMRWAPPGPWSVSVRPEFARDSAGRWTGAEQSIVAVTTTLEYRRTYRGASGIVRLEHRFDHSGGPGGGFFYDGEGSPGVVALKATQHLLILGVILTFDSPSSH